MKKFTDLIETLHMIDENIETRQKAKEFKTSMKPIIKRVKDAEIGDARRYAYMLAWPFMRDVLNIEEMQGQDTPVNSALIQRKLEELYDSGRLPEDAGKQFEAYANEQYDTYVNQKSAMRPKNKGEYVGFDEEESASERAERNRVERELQAQKQAEEGDPGYQLDVEVDEVDKEFQSVVSDIADSLGTRSSTSIIEIFVNPTDGPIVQKQPILSLFSPEDLVGEPEIEADKFVFELTPKSQISKLIAQRGADSVEEYLQDLFSQRLGRDVRVVVHAPEEGGTFEQPLPDKQAPAQDPTDMEKYGGVSYESAKASIAHLIPDAWRPRMVLEGVATGEVTITTGKGNYIVTMMNGSITQIDEQGDAPPVNVNAVKDKMKRHKWTLKDAIISSANVRPSAPMMRESTEDQGVGKYIPESWKAGKYVKPFVETSRERFKVTRSSQIPLF